MSDVVDVSPLHSRLEVRTYPQLAQLRGLRRAPRTKVAPNSGTTAGARAEVAAIVATGVGNGYWLVFTNGSLLAFRDAFGGRLNGGDVSGAVIAANLSTP
jgi:hypothetical protein